jgi:hypothetical protein
LQWSAAVWWVSVIPVGRRKTEKTLSAQIQRSGSTLMCNRKQLNTLYKKFRRFKSLLGAQARIEEVTQMPAGP